MITINIPDNATNEEVLDILFAHDKALNIRSDVHGRLHMRGVKADWLKQPYKKDNEEKYTRI